MRSAKALPLSVEVDADSQLAQLSARCELQRRELHQASKAQADARAAALRDQRRLGQLKGRLQLADERVAQLEEEAATAYAIAREREAHASAQLEQELAEAHERLGAERAKAAEEIANLRDALAAALERERSFRRMEADLKQRLAAHSSQSALKSWESEEPRATLGPVDSGEAVADGLPLVP
ncbi:MAG: hypothetical protein EOO73_02250 [Myxococcales bacterium]|nr:MAG: hypothetical protein EOO73_02250 [Myxococcales bacterium]